MIEATRRDAFIDQCRGIAILMVITIHAGQSVAGLARWTTSITELGQLGVQLFFVVSAYTLCESASRRWFHEGWVSGFFVRRWFRIAPLYYLAIALYFTVSAGMARQGNTAIEAYSLATVAANFALVHGFIPAANNSIVPGGWSIGTEMAFYLTFPPLFWSLSRLASDAARGGMALAAAVIVSAASVYVASTFQDSALADNNSFYFYNLFNQMPVFLAGISAYWWRDQSAARNALVTSLVSVVSSACGVALFYSGLPFAFEMLPIAAGIAFASLALTLRSIGVRAKVIEYIGVRSFSIYIFHFMFVSQAAKIFEIAAIKIVALPALSIFVLTWLTTVIVTTLLATMTEMSIERPFIALGSKAAGFFERREASSRS